MQCVRRALVSTAATHAMPTCYLDRRAGLLQFA
jgi:hypothetical protein